MKGIAGAFFRHPGVSQDPVMDKIKQVFCGIAIWFPGSRLNARPGMTVLIISLFLFNPAHADTFAAHYRAATVPQAVAPLVFTDAQGGQHALSDERGHYMLLNIWATWCAPCVREMPSLQILQSKFDAKQLVILPLSEDRGDAVVTSFYQTHAIKLRVAIDQGGIAPSALKLRGLPTTLLIDPEGREIGRVEGDVDWSGTDVVAFLKSQISK